MPRAATKITKNRLDGFRRKAQADPEFQVYEADAGQPGLYVQARRRRVRFLFVYRPPAGGARRRIQIDDYGAITLDRAREIAREWRGLVAAGKDPRLEIREQDRQATTVEAAVVTYLDHYRQRVETGARRGKRSGYVSARRRLERNVLPKLGAVRLEALTVEQVRALHRSMASTPTEANRTLTAFSAVFGEAARLGLVAPGFNPVRHVERFEEKGERRALTPEELTRLGDAMREAEAEGSIHPSALLALRLLLLTGLRRSELLGHESKARRGNREGLRWADVDLDAGLVRLDDTKTGRQTRVLGRAAVELLRRAKPAEADPEEPVCPGEVPGQPFIGLSRPRRKLYAAAGLAKERGLDIHSLRHTFASVGANLQHGRFAAHVGPLLGHAYTKAGSITERYIHANPEALRPAANAVSGALQGFLGHTEDTSLLEFPALLGRTGD